MGLGKEPPKMFRDACGESSIEAWACPFLLPTSLMISQQCQCRARKMYFAQAGGDFWDAASSYFRSGSTPIFFSPRSAYPVPSAQRYRENRCPPLAPSLFPSPSGVAPRLGTTHPPARRSDTAGAVVAGSPCAKAKPCPAPWDGWMGGKCDLPQVLWGEG